MMTLRNTVLKEKELTDKIEFNIEELAIIADLMTMEKYKNSSTLIKKFDLIEEETLELIKERAKLTDYIDTSNEVLKTLKKLEGSINI